MRYEMNLMKICLITQPNLGTLYRDLRILMHINHRTSLSLVKKHLRNQLNEY